MRARASRPRSHDSARSADARRPRPRRADARASRSRATGWIGPVLRSLLADRRPRRRQRRARRAPMARGRGAAPRGRGPPRRPTDRRPGGRRAGPRRRRRARRRRRRPARRRRTDVTCQEMLVRAGREIGGPSAIAVLARHVEHRDREVGLAVMRALAALGPRTSTRRRRRRRADRTIRRPSVVRDDLEHATHALRALVAFEARPGRDAAARRAARRAGADPPAGPRRVLDAPRHRRVRPGRVPARAARLRTRTRSRWSGSTSRLTGTDRAAVALLEPRLSDRDRLQRAHPHVPARAARATAGAPARARAGPRRPVATAVGQGVRALHRRRGSRRRELDAVMAAAANAATRRRRRRRGPHRARDARRPRAAPPGSRLALFGALGIARRVRGSPTCTPFPLDTVPVAGRRRP